MESSVGPGQLNPALPTDGQAEYPSVIHLLATLSFSDTLSWNHFGFL